MKPLRRCMHTRIMLADALNCTCNSSRHFIVVPAQSEQCIRVLMSCGHNSERPLDKVIAVAVFFVYTLVVFN